MTDKITIERETMERAIRWHESRIWPGPDEVAVFGALRAALAQQAKPVAWRDHVEERIRTWRQRTMTDDLPPLPEPAYEAYYYTADQMRAYGDARAAAATEQAAKVCDEHASIEGIAQACAAAIRQSQS